MAWAAPRIASSCSSRLTHVDGGGMSSGAITSAGASAATSPGDTE